MNRERLSQKSILLLSKHAEIFMDNYQAAMTLRKAPVELVVNLIVKAEEVVRQVNIVAKNMGRIKAGIKTSIKIKGIQYVDERLVVNFVTHVSLANAATRNQPSTMGAYEYFAIATGVG